MPIVMKAAPYSLTFTYVETLPIVNVRGVRIEVAGTPAPKGSVKFVPHRHSRRMIALPVSRALKAWEAAIFVAAKAAMVGRQRWPGDVPLGVNVVIRIRRGASVKRAWPTVRADADKLLRGCLDPLSGVVFHDDAQICRKRITKLYADGAAPGAEIVVYELPDFPTAEYLGP